jgi:hypothetical protein
VTYTTLVMLFLLACVAVGARGGARASRPWVAAALAAAMVVAQFTVLMTK